MRPVRFITGIFGTLAFAVLLFFTCWILAAGCSRAHVLVSNQSGTTVSNLVISGSCKERHADMLTTQSEWLTVTPYDSDGLMRFSFDCAGVGYSTNTELRSGFLGVFYTISSNMMVIIQKKG
jgi:hypothetical protein